jgi:hypothetical protein
MDNILRLPLPRSDPGAGPIIRKYRPLSELSGTKPLFLVEKGQNFRLNARVTTA